MGLEGVVKETKKFFVDEVVRYPGKKGCAIGNGIRAGLGYLGFQYFDSDLIQAVCLTYAVIKGVQFVKDAVRYIW